MEKRSSPRLNMPLGIEYQIKQPDTGETLSGQGTLKNLGPNGAYFICGGPSPLKVGQIWHFNLNIRVADFQASSRIYFQGLLMRIEPVEGEDKTGVAVRFLSPLETGE